MTNITRKFNVQGLVQGVFYRASTREKALSLNLRGYAKNLPDGSVEVLAIGTDAEVQALQDWLWQGPPASKVQNVVEQSVSESDSQHPGGFKTA